MNLTVLTQENAVLTLNNHTVLQMMQNNNPLQVPQSRGVKLRDAQFTLTANTVLGRDYPPAQGLTMQSS